MVAVSYIGINKRQGMTTKKPTNVADKLRNAILLFERGIPERVLPIRYIGIPIVIAISKGIIFSLAYVMNSPINRNTQHNWYPKSRTYIVL